MRRETCTPRPDWQAQLDALGFAFHSPEGKPYWDESACYVFDAQEIDGLEAVTHDLEQMCLQAVQHIIDQNLFERMHIPPLGVPLIQQSWARGDKNLYGRFDLAYDGVQPPKLLEYNADTPTSLVEAAVLQWQWLEACKPDQDQFNSLHERLIEAWRGFGLSGGVHFACVADAVEDYATTLYLQDTASQAGLETQFLYMSDLGTDGAAFFDLQTRPVSNLFKLYPWEWMMTERFSEHLLGCTTQFIEPAWKMLLSNKSLLVILWELFEGHPNLLPAYFSPDLLGGDVVKKPIFGREGANVSLTHHGVVHETGGAYGAEGFVYQAYHALPDFDGAYPIIGSWVVASQPAGIGIREDRARITQDGARFVPHYFEPA
jgi:glutathionylspermidine synthase